MTAANGHDTGTTRAPAGPSARLRARALDRPEAAVAHFAACARIRDAVAAHYGITPAMILSERRSFAVSHPRQVAMYLCKALTQYSLPRIGGAFGRDHTTVMFSCTAVENRMLADPSFKAEVEQLRARLTDPSAVAIEQVIGEAADREADRIEALARRAFAIDPERTVAAIVAALRSIAVLRQAQDEGKETTDERR